MFFFKAVGDPSPVILDAVYNVLAPHRMVVLRPKLYQLKSKSGALSEGDHLVPYPLCDLLTSLLSGLVVHVVVTVLMKILVRVSSLVMHLMVLVMLIVVVVIVITKTEKAVKVVKSKHVIEAKVIKVQMRSTVLFLVSVAAAKKQSLFLCIHIVEQVVKVEETFRVAKVKVVESVAVLLIIMTSLFMSVPSLVKMFEEVVKVMESSCSSIAVASIAVITIEVILFPFLRITQNIISFAYL